MATAALVSFTTMRGVGSAYAPGPGSARVRENFATLPAVTTNAAVDGETAFVLNNSTAAAIACAIGSSPDATALAATASTSAGFPIAPGEVAKISMRTGEKISLAALP
jgi:hypothetical protein